MDTDQSGVQSRSEVEGEEELDLADPFLEEERLVWTIAIGLVYQFRHAMSTGGLVGLVSDEEGSDAVEPAKIRCHEMAAAIGQILRLPVQTGWVGLRLGGFGGIEHSWLWTKPLPAEGEDPDAWTANILDVRVMGGHPEVQLVSCHPALAQAGLRYRSSDTPRTDVDLVQVERLVRFFREYMERVSPKKRT